MMMKCVVDNGRITLIDGLSIIERCQYDIISDLEMYEMLDKQRHININKIDTQRVFYFYILKNICDTVMESNSSTRCVVTLNNNCVSDYSFDIINLYGVETDKFCSFVSRLFKRMNNILPTQFYIQHDQACFNQLENMSTPGEYREMINDILAQHDKKSRKSFTFEKAKKFIDKYGLTYLNNEYFSKVKIKSLMYK